jgi:hypothetical protein
MDETPIKLFGNGRGGLYLVKPTTPKTVMKFNEDLVFDSDHQYTVDSKFVIVNYFKDYWFGYNEKSVAILKAKVDK